MRRRKEEGCIKDCDRQCIKKKKGWGVLIRDLRGGKKEKKDMWGWVWVWVKWIGKRKKKGEILEGVFYGG